MKKLSFIILCAIFYAFILVGCAEKPQVFDGEFLERKLAPAYSIEGILTQNGEKYDVILESSGGTIKPDGTEEFRIKFLSGDVTEGLTVEFFESGAFLFFDDLRFKTNSETFTNLEALRDSFALLSAAHVEKKVIDSAPVSGDNQTGNSSESGENAGNIIEIGADGDSGSVKAFINKSDGTILRLITDLRGSDIILDVKKFENIIAKSDDSLNPEQKTEPVYEVVDDYIEEYIEQP